MLSKEQADEFRERGYIVLKRVVPAAHIADLKSAAERIVADFDSDAQRTVFSTRDNDRGRDDYFMDSAESVHCFLEEDAVDEDGKLTRAKHLAINKIGHAMHDLVPEFGRFCRQPIIAEIMHDIGYRSPSLWQSMYIFKQPRIGGEVRWHQDASYLHTDPSSVTGLWIAIEDSHQGNGCLWVEPGGHRSPLREIFEVDPESRRGVLRRLDDTPWPTETDGVALEVPAGSAVVFNDHLPHYSSQNFSAASRHAFTMHFAEQGAAWSKSNWLQRPNLGEFVV